MQTTPISSKKNIQTDEKDDGEDEPLEKPPASNPSKKVVIHEDYPDQTITIRGNLTDKCRSELIEMLHKHADAFAWTPAYMTGIPCSVIEHELKTYPHIEPKVRYPTWVANPVLVKKSDDSWRMCIDFKDLNKACPKDLYPLPEIDWKIESLMGLKYKCFLDAYKGYHQIQMAKKDEEKTAFHTDEGVFCYTKMPFGLKNARATYQRLVNTIFEGQIGRNLEAYVDGMVIKSKTELEMIKDVEETLMKLKKYANKKDFHWTTEAEEAFQAMKKLIAELPTLIAPRKEEELMVYLSAANEAVSAVLLVERDGRQIPIHYILNNLEATGRLAKWGVELEAYDIKYASRSAIKGQVLTDFLEDTMTEDSPTQEKTNGPDDTLAERESMEEQEATVTRAPENLKAEADIWKLYTDGASNEHGSGAGLILIDPEGAEYSYALRLNFANSNNDAEYKALLAGLRIATKMKVEKMHAFIDSKLVANQVEGSYEAKSEKTKKYKEKTLEIIRSFNNFWISHKPREENRKVDALSKLAAVQCPQQANYLIEDIHMGSCGMHDGPRRAVHKAMNVGYFIQVCIGMPTTRYQVATHARFRVRAIIITDNGTQLINDPFKSWA
ncbi:reverse transcriptase domain-containing protein [Tanacetum coccineum]